MPQLASDKDSVSTLEPLNDPQRFIPKWCQRERTCLLETRLLLRKLPALPRSGFVIRHVK